MVQQACYSENMDQKQSAGQAQRVEETLQLKTQAKKIGKYEASSAVHSQTTGGDLSEQSLILSAIAAAKERHTREQRARAKMGLPGKTVPKPAAEDKDALQRQREQALGE